MTVEKKNADRRIIKLYGRLDAASSSGCEKKVMAVIDEGIRQVILDCTRLDYINSAGLRMLLRIEQRLGKSEGIIVLCGLKNHLQEIFDVTGWACFLPVVDTVAEAMYRVESAGLPCDSAGANTHSSGHTDDLRSERRKS